MMNHTSRSINNKTLQKIIENRNMKKRLEKEWRKHEIHFRLLEQNWWAVDQKRIYTDQRVELLSVLVELAAFASGFQMVMLYELELPSLVEFHYNHVLLGVWGFSSLAVICVNICIVYFSGFIAVDILSDSAREHPWSLTETEITSPPGCPARGTPEYALVFGRMPAINNAEQMQMLWCQKHEKRVLRVLAAFNYSAPAFMFNIGLTTIAKFYVAPTAGWIGFFLSLCGMVAWWRFHYPKVQHLRWSSDTVTYAGARMNNHTIDRVDFLQTHQRGSGTETALPLPHSPSDVHVTAAQGGAEMNFITPPTTPGGCAAHEGGEVGGYGRSRVEGKESAGSWMGLATTNPGQISLDFASPALDMGGGGGATASPHYISSTNLAQHPLSAATHGGQSVRVGLESGLGSNLGDGGTGVGASPHKVQEALNLATSKPTKMSRRSNGALDVASNA